MVRFAYIIEGITSSPWPPHGGVFYYDAGTTRDRVKLVHEKFMNAGFNIIERVVMLDIEMVARATQLFSWQVARMVKRLSYNAMRFVVQRVFASVREPPFMDIVDQAPDMSMEVASLGGKSAWKPFYIKCKNQCSPSYDRRGNIMAISHLGEAGGFGCPVCGGTGGTYIDKEGHSVALAWS